MKCPVLIGHLEATVASPSMRRVWIEIQKMMEANAAKVQSPSMRRVWIEIVKTWKTFEGNMVTLHAEGVD